MTPVVAHTVSIYFRLEGIEGREVVTIDALEGQTPTVLFTAGRLFGAQTLLMAMSDGLETRPNDFDVWRIDIVIEA